MSASRKGPLNPNWRGGPEARPQCSVLNCRRKIIAKGLCGAHYQRVKKTGDVQADVPVSTSRFGSRNSNWKGGVRISRGRVYLVSPGHPNACKNGCVARYRLVMERKLGRYLKPDEIVHHLGSVNDDAPDKLQVMSQTEHCRTHFAKISIDTVRRIREAAKTLKPKQVAKQFGMDVSRVYPIINNETWKGV